jgi:mono/diheme cytochrome c family protein
MKTAIAFLALTSVCSAAELPPPANRPVDFVKDIQPIFETKCAKCHGAEKQKGGYRLDDRQTALHGGDEHAPNIKPGSSADSPLVQFIAGLDPDMKMPSKGDPLTAEQIGLVRAWIDQGAVWPDSASAGRKDPKDWWSLKAIVRSPLPEIRNPKFEIRNPIDAFIVSKLAENGLTPTSEADPRTLIRRLYFDLIGLPPTPEEADAFVTAYNSPSTDHNSLYATTVDQLLATPRHGERWARHWLDVVHFGETHGYDKDQPRPNAWPYRDYVIRAFNEDKPFARFVQEQIAGDVLFPNTADGIEALGFISAGPWDFIGHAEVPETKIDGKIARHLDRDDMISNTINTFCSLTVHCAQCHNHKFDPIPQEDYYSLQAVFAAVDRADKVYDLDPAVAAQRAELTAKQRSLKAKKEELEKALTKAGGNLAGLLDRLIDEGTRGPEAGERVEFGWHSNIESKQDVVKWVQVDLGSPRPIEEIVIAACHDSFNNIGAGFGFPVRFKVEVSDDEKFTGAITLDDQTAADVANPGITPLHIRTARTARYIRVTATKLAPRMNDFIFALAELRAVDKSGGNLALGAAVTSLDSIEAAPRWGRANLTDGYYYGGIAKLPPDQLAALKKRRDELLAKAAQPEMRDQSAAATRDLAEVSAAIAKLPPPRTAFIGTIHNGTGNFIGTGANGGQPRPIFLLARGDVTKPGKPIVPGALSAIDVLPAHFDANAPEGERRAALARWISDSKNPLTWRSIVNRVWQYHFGRGLVDSPNDFGHMGQLPSHPELLDWLAAEFRDSGGSFKKLHRLIVTSATYRQASARPRQAAATVSSASGTSAGAEPAASPAPDEIDANNSLLWRQNRRKLEAEAIRDSLLSVAGQLDLKMGGPSFQDFVVTHPEHSPHYEYQLADPENPALHRRSIYRFLVRSQQQPFMSALDCADPSMLVDKRNQTLTPLQALAQLNNQLALAMAKQFAARVEKAGDPSAQITTAFRLALARPPSTEELHTLTAYAAQFGLANTCRAILNLNEFAFVD